MKQDYFLLRTLCDLISCSSLVNIEFFFPVGACKTTLPRVGTDPLDDFMALRMNTFSGHVPGNNHYIYMRTTMYITYQLLLTAGYAH